MNTIDEQLDAANVQVAELKAQVTTLTDALQAAEQNNAILETVNAELTDNLADTKERLAKQEAATHDALAQEDQLKAEAKCNSCPFVRQANEAFNERRT